MCPFSCAYKSDGHFSLWWRCWGKRSDPTVRDDGCLPAAFMLGERGGAEATQPSAEASAIAGDRESMSHGLPSRSPSASGRLVKPGVQGVAGSHDRTSRPACTPASGHGQSQELTRLQAPARQGRVGGLSRSTRSQPATHACLNADTCIDFYCGFRQAVIRIGAPHRAERRVPTNCHRWCHRRRSCR
jgi:hypothetical protein